MERGEGERLYKEQRARFWKILGGLALAGALGGFVAGFVLGHSDASSAPLSSGWTTVGAAAIVLSAILAAYGSWRFFVSVDEVEVADNLWGSLIGFYVYAIVTPAWWALARLDAAPELNHWVVYVLSFLTAALAYAYRKWRMS